MDAVNLKRYKYIKEARKSRVKWTLCSLLLVALLLVVLIFIAKRCTFGIFLFAILMFVLLCILIISFYLYIQFFAKCYKCLSCSQKFLDNLMYGYYKELRFFYFGNSRLAGYGAVKEYGDQLANRLWYHRLFVKCPYCGKKMLWMDAQVNFDEEEM